MRGRTFPALSFCIFLCAPHAAAAQSTPAAPDALLGPGAAPSTTRAASAAETASPADTKAVQPLQTGVLLVPGATPSATDHVTAVPERSRIVDGTYHNDYFGLAFRLPDGWTEQYEGPMPSDSGAYVLAELVPSKSAQVKGTIVITAQDNFFSLRPARDAMAVVKDMSDRLETFYRAERAPQRVTIAHHDFARFDYMSPAAQLHWYVLTTEIRCHAVQFVFTSRDVALLDSLVKDMESMTFGSESDNPVCVAGYAAAANVTYKVEPALNDRKFNAIPLRIVIDKLGRVKHVHVISAFADQARIVTDAVVQWRFKPYLQNGEPIEVETGILFGTARRSAGEIATASSAN